MTAVVQRVNTAEERKKEQELAENRNNSATKGEAGADEARRERGNEGQNRVPCCNLLFKAAPVRSQRMERGGEKQKAAEPWRQAWDAYSTNDSL